MKSHNNSQINLSAKLSQIVPKQSAILTAYPNNGIHATHTGMTRFKTAQETGYIRVRDQLWLWYNMIEESQTARKEESIPAKMQEQRLIQPGSVAEIEGGESLYSGPVHYGSGDSNGIYAEGGTLNVNIAKNDFHQHQHHGSKK
jgi:hypothetical protein